MLSVNPRLSDGSNKWGDSACIKYCLYIRQKSNPDAPKASNDGYSFLHVVIPESVEADLTKA